MPNLTNSSLQAYVEDGGRSSDFLFRGPKVTHQIEAELHFGENGYRFKLAPTADEDFLINDEARYYEGDRSGWWELGGGYTTPKLLKDKDKPGASGSRSVSAYVYDAIAAWKIYHFHDTSRSSGMRRLESVDDDEYLRFDASNIAPFLYYLRENEEDSYKEIVNTIRLVAPFFQDFILRPRKEKVRLQWRQKGSDYPLKPFHLSDGTIRFICLTTALLQPKPPSTILIDEPELGLHPYALDVLAELIQASAKRTQLIVSTQSAPLVDSFSPEDVIVVERMDGGSSFKRLSEKYLSDWLQDYSLGDLWRKNIVGGGPANE